MHQLDGHIFVYYQQNQVFTELLVHLRAQFLDYLIKKICFGNTGEITSHAFHEYCMSIGVEVEYPVAHVQTQNGLA